jgi:predicted O-linked N-acetylglucosamine transferase (SPINDLY family)
LQLAHIQLQVYELDDCRQSLAQLQRLGHSDEAQALAMSLEGQYGDAKASLQQLQAAYERQQAAGEHNSRLVSSVLMTALYQDDWTPTQMAQLHQRYGQALAGAAPLAQVAPLPPAATRARPTSLRVGYVTGDLHRQHPVNIFMLPLLQAQQHSSLQVHIYHTGTMFDSYTERARACAKHWVEAAQWDDATLQHAIAQDGIDVLIDLAGHTASHRLGVFMARPAPVQVTFLGYPHSTGLPCMDYLIGDAVVSPPEHAHLFSESVARLDYPVFCWAPVDAYALPPARAADAPVVFGSFNNALKLSDRTLALWAKVLHAVPGSRLLLKAPSLRNAAVQARYLAELQALGIEAWRVEFRGPSELADMMQQYGDIDIALDPLVYNGGTTSLQALWMGVPLVTLTGGNFASRMGTSFLTALGRAEWIAHDEARYVAIAQDLASQVQTLRPLRPQLRQQMEASPLCDITGYARSFEALLWQMSDATRTAAA